MRLKTNSENIKHFFFKSGENHIQVLKDLSGHEIDLFSLYEGDSSLFKLAMIVDALRRQKHTRLSLTIPYFPGARQDRVCNSGEALSVKVYADFINKLEFDEVKVFDPHSDVVAALVNNVKIVKNHDFIFKAIQKHPTNYSLVSPDAGANKKIFDLAKALGGPKVIRADKVRDVTDGKIIGTEVYADDLAGQTCYIVDDLISGGKTFIELAKVLKAKGAEKIYLIVSHHEGVASEKSLKEAGLNGVITTNSLPGACLSDNQFTKVEEISKFI